MSLNIFVTGATGYIGGSVIAQLLKHPDFKSFSVTALVRNAEKGAKLNSLGIKTIIGGYADLDVLTNAASEADFVIAMADSDNYAAARAILDGMKLRFSKTAVAPVLIHTSGTAIVMDDARGLHGDHRVYSDLDVDVIEALPATAFHRNVDIPIVAADKEGYVKAHIITPGTVFGAPSGPLVDLGIQNTHSIQIPLLLKASIGRKQAGYINAGRNVWAAVSVDDVADLYVTVFNAIRSNPDNVGHGREGFYFAENCEYSALEIAEAAGKALVELGVTTNADYTSFTEAELEKYFGKLWPFLCTNSRVRADRSRALGWKPVDGKDALLASVKAETAEFVNTEA